MIYVGCHVNVVNLRKAITADMRKRGELYLLVEFAQHGNLRTYLRDRRATFKRHGKEVGRQDSNGTGGMDDFSLSLIFDKYEEYGGRGETALFSWTKITDILKK